MLTEQGATILYGNQDSWGSIEVNAVVLKENLDKFIMETNFEKVNIIAHSKGGIEARYMISTLGMAGKVASLTTIATIHNGSKTMDLLCKLPTWLFKIAAKFVNFFFKILGDSKPDFHTACTQFTTSHMKSFNDHNPDAPDVYYQSYAAVLKSPFSDILMLLPSSIVWLIEGENDGLVTPSSATWTNFKGILRGATHRGISHADEVDARRMNFTRRTSDNGVSDIRKVYSEIVFGLQQMGL